MPMMLKVFAADARLLSQHGQGLTVDTNMPFLNQINLFS